MDFYKDLYKNRNTYAGRLNMAIFYTNLFLILVHVFLSVFYFLVGHKLMFIVNLLSLVLYFSGLKFCTRHKDLFLRLCFAEIWIHTLLGIICFGWNSYFQNWIFALVAAVFLPTFYPVDHKQSYKQSFLFTFILLLSYYLFALLVNNYDFALTIKLEGTAKDFIFAFNNFVAFSGIMMFAITYTRNKESREFELIRRANFDELTCIYNRHGVDTIVTTMLDKSKIYSVAILDIDSFKLVNDKYGHKSGDMVLKELGKILESHTSKYISVGRWGGEEFIVIGNSRIEYDDFINELDKIRLKVSETKFLIRNKRRIKCTVSIGSKHIKNGISIEEAVSKADINLYKAKQTGKNKVVS